MHALTDADAVDAYIAAFEAPMPADPDNTSLKSLPAQNNIAALRLENLARHARAVMALIAAAAS